MYLNHLHKNTHIFIISILCGLLGLFLSTFDISYSFGTVEISVFWSLLFPVTASLAYGIRGSLIAGLTGGAYYPFLIWPGEGYANLLSMALLMTLYLMLGFYRDFIMRKQKRKPVLWLILILLLLYLALLWFVYDILFNPALSVNPPFWTDEVMSHLPVRVLHLFMINNIFNFTLIIIFSETWLRLPVIRRVLKLPVPRWMRQNSQAFLLSISLAITIWLVFILLDVLMLKHKEILHPDYMSLSFLVVFWSGSIIGRFLIRYLENKIEAEDSLRKSEGQLRAIIENVPSVVYRCLADVEKTMIVISDKIINLTGYTAEDFITHRRSILDLVHEKDKGNVYKFMQRQIDENIEIEMEFRIIDRFGALHWIYEKSSVFVDEEELVRYIDGIFEDITQRKENELEIEQYKMHLEKLVNIRTKRLKEVNEELQETLKELKSAQGNLVQAEKMASLGVLTAGVAHELNNPLNFIQGGYTGLERLIEESEGFPKEEGTVMMNSIKEGLRRAVNIVKSLNQFSRTRDANNEWCRIHSILDNCILMLNHEIKHKITLNKNYQAVHDLLEGNSGKLHQVFINVLTNAIQAIDNKGEVEICTSNENENIKIEITDTGCGISPQNLGKVTDPFFTTKGPGEGTGLGLSISYKIIKEHRGTIFLKSVETKGTTVTIELPVLNCG